MKRWHSAWGTFGRPLTIDEFLPLALQCGAALAAAHEKRIVHLDVKPANIMLTPAGQVRRCDFGVARQLTTGNSNVTTVLSSTRWIVAGTPSYMAPEVILNQEFDERADLFSLGTVFYEMLTGRNPFRADSAIATTAQVVSLEPPPMSTVKRGFDPRLERIVKRMMAKDPSQRYQNAGELLEELTALGRSRNRVQEMTRNVREAFAESWLLKVAAAIVVLFVAATPPMVIYADRVGQWLGISHPARKNTILVFGFRAEGAGLSQPFADGLADVLAGQLRMLPGIDVVSVLEVLESGITKPGEAFRRFGAKVAITGKFHRVGDVLQIGLSLVDGNDGRVLDHRELTPRFNSLTIQNQVVEAATELLKLQLTRAERIQLSTLATENPSAHALYLEGKGLLATRERENVERAIDLFQDAIAKDPDFSLAYAGLGLAFRAKYQLISRDQQWAKRAVEACDQAVTHDPELAAAHTCLGAAYNLRGDDLAAIKEYEIARKLDPHDDEIYRGLGRAYESNNLIAAESMYLAAVKIKPDYWYNYVWLGQFYGFSRQQYDEAIKQFQEAIKRAPDNPVPYLSLSGAQILKGAYEDAVNSCKKSISLSPSDRAYNNLGQAYFNLRRYADAARAYEASRQLNSEYYKTAGQLARAYYWMGDHAQAKELWQKAMSWRGLNSK